MRPDLTDGSDYPHQLAEEFSGLTREILRLANQGVPRIEFVREVLRLLVEFSEVDQVEIRVNDGRRFFCGVLHSGDRNSYRFSMRTRKSGVEPESAACAGDTPGLTLLCQRVMFGEVDRSSAHFTANGSFWTDDTSKSISLSSPGGWVEVNIDASHRSLAIIRFAVSEDSHGLVLFWDREPAVFRRYDISFYEGVAQTIGVALADRRAQAALRERMKELTCLYGIDRVLEQTGATLAQRLQGVVALLPPAWLYPHLASARIIVDGAVFTAGDFGGPHVQSAPVVVRGQQRGVVEVCYSQTMPDLDEGPFLNEERSLIDAVAKQVALMLEHQQAEEERVGLEAQLRHADRLATIGQLAAGVAHELNEPLGSILGFGQLVQKTPGLPDSAARDVQKIVDAALHAREVVSKLMLFARQKPPTKTRVALNELIQDGLYFLSARCAKSDVELVRVYGDDLPDIVADPGQLHQVLINLVVNAIQAMPHGGRLTIRTTHEDGYVVLAVEDTGVGMSEEVKRQIFVPFFTTKGVGEGTGLGLPVVHGIVTGHAGRIEVSSELGKGSVFRVLLPVKASEQEQSDAR
ncbi:MAG: ATP-binding protein [candidate division WOR-3 bacterium]